MNEQIKELLETEVQASIHDLANLPAGSKERTAAVEDLVKMYNLIVDESEDETDFKEKQLKEQAKDRYFKLGLEAGSIILPMIFYAIWMRKGFKFEETGTYTSTTFRGLFSRFKPTTK